MAVFCFAFALCIGLVASRVEAQFLLSANACLLLGNGSSSAVASFYALDSDALLNATVVCEASFFFGVRFENVSGLTFATASSCQIGPGGVPVTGQRLENIRVKISSATIVAGPVRVVAWEAALCINAPAVSLVQILGVATPPGTVRTPPRKGAIKAEKIVEGATARRATRAKPRH